MRFPTFFALVPLLGALGCAPRDGEVGETSDRLSKTCGYDAARARATHDLLEAPFEDADDVAVRFRCLTEILTVRRDRRAAFASVYTLVTSTVHDGLSTGRFTDPAWTGKLLTAFAERYRAAYVGFEEGRGDDIPESWRISFETAKKSDEARARRAKDNVLVLQHLVLGVNAHMHHDLARAVADIGFGGEDADYRKRDFDAVRDLLEERVSASLDTLIDNYAKHLGEAPSIVRNLMEKIFYAWIFVGREKAWFDARALLRGGIPEFVASKEINLTAKLVARGVLAPNIGIADDVMDRLKAYEGSQ